MDHSRETNSASGPRDGQTGLQLLDVLRELRNLKCTLASDKICGVLDLATDKDTFEEPDYNLDPAEVFKTFTTAYLTTRRSYDPLYCCAKSNEKSDVSSPSWVPDWTHPCHHEPLIFKHYGSHAAGGSEVDFRFEQGNARLVVRGKHVDTIKVVETLRRIQRNAIIDQPLVVQGQVALEGKESEPVRMTPDIVGSSHEAWRKANNEKARLRMLNIWDVAFPDKYISAESFEALWCTSI